jgi:hypothetical protein
MRSATSPGVTPRGRSSSPCEVLTGRRRLSGQRHQRRVESTLEGRQWSCLHAPGRAGRLTVPGAGPAGTTEGPVLVRELIKRLENSDCGCLCQLEHALQRLGWGKVFGGAVHHLLRPAPSPALVSIRGEMTSRSARWPKVTSHDFRPDRGSGEKDHRQAGMVEQGQEQSPPPRKPGRPHVARSTADRSGRRHPERRLGLRLRAVPCS